MTTQGDEAPARAGSATHDPGPRPPAAGPEPEEPAARRRFRYTLPGSSVALAFACLAFTPSLLPRSAVLQGVVCGITAAVGYGVGVAGAWTWRAFADRDPRPPRPGAWQVFTIVAAVALVVALILGRWWQAQLRDLMGAPTPNPLLLVLLPLLGIAIFTGLVALSRSLRGAYHWVAHRLHRWMGARAANALGWVVVVVATYLVTSGLLLNGLASVADRSFAVRNGATADGVT
ncbi:MAG TPA: alpha/beta-hydrolase N-terminal domain-containing protein, partial [Actinomycetota bacterium]|nr:alpha/beta-hydrolase N-terminal domain-containing protein [Actinomycetota bacterium]